MKFSESTNERTFLNKTPKSTSFKGVPAKGSVNHLKFIGELVTNGRYILDVRGKCDKDYQWMINYSVFDRDTFWSR